MNLLADENVDQPIVNCLRQDGHNVLYIAELSPSIPDDDILQQANNQTALLLTGDKDFGELVFRQKLVHGGVVLIRLLGISASLKADIVANAFRSRGNEMPGGFTVISPGMVRVRKGP